MAVHLYPCLLCCCRYPNYFNHLPIHGGDRASVSFHRGICIRKPRGVTRHTYSLFIFDEGIDLRLQLIKFTSLSHQASGSSKNILIVPPEVMSMWRGSELAHKSKIGKLSTYETEVCKEIMLNCKYMRKRK